MGCSEKAGSPGRWKPRAPFSAVLPSMSDVATPAAAAASEEAGSPEAAGAEVTATVAEAAAVAATTAAATKSRWNQRVSAISSSCGRVSGSGAGRRACHRHSNAREYVGGDAGQDQ